MPKNSAVNITLQNQTGTGLFVGSDSPIINTPELVGIVSGIPPQPQNIGATFSSFVTSQAIVSNTLTNVTFLIIGAGDYDIYGSILTNPDVTTTQAVVECGLGITSLTLPLNTYASTGPIGAGIKCGLTAPMISLNSNGLLAVYLVARVDYAVSTLDINGDLRIRRRS